MEWIKIFDDSATAREQVRPDHPQLVVIGRTRICLSRFNDVFYAVGDRCSHRGESLSKGTINFAGEIICPWHGYRFDLKTGRCAESNPDIPIYPIKEDVDGFFIGI